MKGNAIDPREVINGSYGELWIDDEYMAEVIAVEAKVDIEYEDIKRVRNLGVGKKMLGYEGTGSIKLHKVSSRFIKKQTEHLMQGKQYSATVILKLDDPDSLGAERVVLKGVTFNDLTLANWEAATAGEEEVDINFETWEFLDTID